jgi:hypothetical protein
MSRIFWLDISSPYGILRKIFHISYHGRTDDHKITPYSKHEQSRIPYRRRRRRRRRKKQGRDTQRRRTRAEASDAAHASRAFVGEADATEDAAQDATCDVLFKQN